MIILMPVGGVQLYVKGQNKRSCAFYHLLKGDQVFASQALFPASGDGVLIKLVVKVKVGGWGGGGWGVLHCLHGTAIPLCYDHDELWA